MIEAMRQNHQMQLEWMYEHQNDLQTVCAMLFDRVRNGKKILICGNGGSAAEAQHFTAELVNGMNTHNGYPYPAICLNSDNATLTAIANDRGYEQVFSQQIKALGEPGDIVVLFSTSGNSKNIVHAEKMARQRALISIGIFGLSAAGVAETDFMLMFPGMNVQRIQEMHLYIIHQICEYLEKRGGELIGRYAAMFENKGNVPGYDAMAKANYHRQLKKMSMSSHL